MSYVLWDVEAGNIVSDFATEVEALSAVRDLLADNALDYVDAMSLGHTDDHGATRVVAEGHSLATLAFSEVTDSSRHAL